LALVVLASSALAETYEKRRVRVLGREMAYVETGEGDPIVFLHGNPSSSYLWRNVIPHLAAQGRCIAPDLIGMGDSEKLPPAGEDGDDGRYRYTEQRRYLFALLERLGVQDSVTLVLHDWGSALGFDWASRHEKQLRGIAYMEAFVRPLSYDELGFAGSLMFRTMRGPLGELLIMRWNLFVEAILPASVLRSLEPEELDAYRAPYVAGGEDRRALLTWPREVPFDGEPADTHQIVSTYSKWLRRSTVPKLLISADPGALLTGDVLEYARGFPNQREVTVRGAHFIQEDSPDEIGRALSEWLTSLPAN
jgi:haloalkane dehalogenase